MRNLATRSACKLVSFLIILTYTTLSLTIPLANAITPNDLYDIVNNTPFYDPTSCDPTVGGGPGGGPDITGRNANAGMSANCPASGSGGICTTGGGGTPVTITGNNPKDAYIFLTQNGYTPAQAAGIIGNLMWESGSVNLNPTAQTPGNPAFGIAQWQGSRLTDMRAFVTGEGKDPNGFAGQLDFLLHELNTSESGSAAAVKATNTPAAAATAFEQNYERAGIPKLAERINYANLIFSQYGGTAAGTATSLPSTTPSSGCSGGGSGGSGGGGGSGSGAPGTCQNPFRDIKNLVPKRVDQGVDYAGDGPVYAICPGKILNLTNSGWPNGGYIGEQLTGGPYAGLVTYMAEDCPATVTIGQQVDSTTQICTMHTPSSSNIETGWSAPAGTGDPLAKFYGGSGKYVTTAGVSYNKFLVSLGTPSGTGNLASPIGSPLPATYP